MCHNSKEFYRQLRFPNLLMGKVCSNDPYFYQACDQRIGGKITNNEYLCENYMCLFWKIGIATTRLLESTNRICNGIVDCPVSELDEANCPDDDFVKMPSGELIRNNTICDDNCSAKIGYGRKLYCEDEAVCNGYEYGMYCKDEFGNKSRHLFPEYICNGYKDCPNGEDEANCQVTIETIETCRHRNSLKTVPVHDFTKCFPPTTNHLTNKLDSTGMYCEKYVESHSNCTDPSRVGIICKVAGYLSTVSKYMICFFDEKICDDGIEKVCYQISKGCTLHKHFMCDDEPDCNDNADEKHLICSSKTEGTCKRKVGNRGELTLPLSWLEDGVQDCVDGSDEMPIWPTCGISRTKRFVKNDNLCENVFICPNEEPGYVELKDLCDGIETCGNENQICKQSRSSTIKSVSLLTTDKGLTKRISYCKNGLKSIELQKSNCTSEVFIFPEHITVFGVDTKTTLHLPSSKQDCDHLFGEQYVYTSCTNKCANSPCPLRTIPRYEYCPDQFPNRIGTIANNEYLVFYTRSFEDIYTNRYFICEDKIRCLDYSKVCDLIKDCEDGSDENSCTNHYKCSTDHYIPKTKVCDGVFDCFNLSDECNDECSKEILENNLLKVMSWVIGLFAVLANLFIIMKNVGTLRRCETSVALINKSLITLISSGDFLIGCYLIVISVYDTIIFKKGYCVHQIDWITSIKCSAIGIVSTIGSQISLFSMTVLSLVRIHGIWNPMRIPGEVNIKKCLQILTGILSIAIASTAIAVTPLIGKFEDFFVNALKFPKELQLFIGTPNKQQMFNTLEGYYGRMKATTLSWDLINKMTRQMFSHDLNYEDHTVKETKVDFYGNDGVCLFKYFVKDDDPQRIFVWALILLNFVCFIIITISYTLIGFISIKSSRQLTGGQNDRQVEKRNSKMNRRISLIIASDFACWLPFISICILHSMEVVDATPWYGYFSMIVLPINSVINPLLFDDAVTSFFMTALRRTKNRVKNSAIAVKVVARFRKRIQEETMELGEVKVHTIKGVDQRAKQSTKKV